jgi:hypothetical protein
LLEFNLTIVGKGKERTSRNISNQLRHIHLIGGGHLSEMTTQKSEKKWTFERKKNKPKERNLKNQMDI